MLVVRAGGERADGAVEAPGVDRGVWAKRRGHLIGKEAGDDGVPALWRGGVEIEGLRDSAETLTRRGLIAGGEARTLAVGPGDVIWVLAGGQGEKR